MKTCARLLAIGLPIVALCFPTSINTEILPILQHLIVEVGIVIFAIWLLYAGALDRIALLNAVAINALLIIFTLLTLPTNASSNLGFGYYEPFLLLSIVFACDFRAVRCRRVVETMWVVANGCALVLAATMIWAPPSAFWFIKDYYSVYYAQLVPMMLAAHKPVLVFGSHSLAAFFFGLCFCVNFLTYVTTRRVVWLVLALANLAMCPFLYCASGYCMVALGAVYLFSHLRGTRASAIAVACLALGAIVCLADSENILQRMDVVFSSPSNGFHARFGDSGGLNQMTSYITEHPFFPAGFGFTPNGFAADCGPVELWMRGSLPLLVMVYFGLWRFLRKNLIRQSHALPLFLLLMACEFGYSNLWTPRIAMLLTVFVMQLNAAVQSRVERDSAARPTRRFVNAGILKFKPGIPSISTAEGRSRCAAGLNLEAVPQNGSERGVA